MPGDLVFWSSNGSQSGIHHVAIYIGNGNVIQAPQSGDIVRVTPLGEVDFGLLRRDPATDLSLSADFSRPA